MSFNTPAQVAELAVEYMYLRAHPRTDYDDDAFARAAAGYRSSWRR